MLGRARRRSAGPDGRSTMRGDERPRRTSPFAVVRVGSLPMTTRTGSSVAAASSRRRRRRASGRGRGRRPRRSRRHSRPRQHAPPPLSGAHARAGAAGRPLHLAAGAVPRLGRDRRRGRVRGGANRPGRAGAVRLHDGLRPPLPLPARARRPDRGRGAGGGRGRAAARRVARLHGPRRLGRRAAARRDRRGDRRRARRHGAARVVPARERARRARPDRRRPVLAVLGHRPADDGVGTSSPGAWACRCTPTSPRPSRRRSTAEPLRLPAGRVSGGARLARERRLVRPLRLALRRATSSASPRRAPASPTARARTFASARAWLRCAGFSTRAFASAWGWTDRPRTSAATSSSR